MPLSINGVAAVINSGSSATDQSENLQAIIYKALRPVLADSVSTYKSGFDMVTDSLEQKNT